MLDNHLVRLRAQNNLSLFAGFQGKDKEVKLPLLIPREFDINPRVTFVGKIVLPVLHTLLLGSQPTPLRAISITTKYIDRYPTASMPTNPRSGDIRVPRWY